MSAEMLGKERKRTLEPVQKKPIEYLLEFIVNISRQMIVSGANWLSKSGHPNQDRLMIVLSIISIVAGLIIALSRAGTAWIATACGFSLIYTAITGFLGERMFHG